MKGSLGGVIQEGENRRSSIFGFWMYDILRLQSRGVPNSGEMEVHAGGRAQGLEAQY